jgi:peptidoglycan/LPS O-acetylase OafA/YrhL
MGVGAPRARRKGALSILDSLRGASALVVVASHSAALLLTGSILLLPLHLGYAAHAAVIMFFLISGFCIHYSQSVTAHYAPEAARSGINLARYARRRFRRIYPPFVLAIVLTIAFDWLGARLNPDVYAAATRYDFINYSVSVGHHSLRTLGGNLLMQGGLFTRTFGTNGPLWSLSYEFWFYVLYPLLWFTAGRRGAGRAAVPVALVSIGGLVVLHLVGPIYLVPALAAWGIWFGGAILADLHVGRLQVRTGTVYALCLAAAVVAYGLYRTLGDLGFLDYALAFVFAAFLNLVLSTRGGVTMAGITVVARALSPLGRISYSLYLVHFPWLLLLSAWWLSHHNSLPGSPLLAVGGVASSLALASVSWLAVERRFTDARPEMTRPTRLAAEPVISADAVNGAVGGEGAAAGGGVPGGGGG